ncbi:hypothetical protein AAAX75_08450 [Collinsella sp. CLA-ER-H7]|uniref:hypothetical protein n=1 Tax=Collinsella sp. CLA-ER-H7 TaxID=3136230 RepID=UPI0032C076EE
MAQMLSSLIAEYAQSHYADEDPGDRFEAQKAMESQIVSEICEERAQEIASKSREIELTEQMKNARHELMVAVVECVILAIPVGLVGSHIYDLLRTGVYGAVQDFNLPALWAGLFILVLFCAFILFGMFLNQVLKAVDSIRDARDSRG